MAASDERRMLFDIRGRRKNVIRVVYAALALLMGASLFVAVGPFNLSELLGTGGTTSAADALDDTAERIEGRLVKAPNDEGLLISLTRTRIAAGNARTEEDPATGTRVVTPEARAEFEAGQDAWQRYLEVAKGDPSPSAAQLVAGSYFGLAETSSTLGEIEEALAGAADAQKVAAEARPNVNSLTTLAIYQYYNGEFAAGDKTAKRAEAEATSKSQVKAIEKQLATYRKRGKAWNKQAEKLAKLQSKQGKEQLQNPLQSFGGTAAAP
jgi:hypothetical protein